MSKSGDGKDGELFRFNDLVFELADFLTVTILARHEIILAKHNLDAGLTLSQIEKQIENVFSGIKKEIPERWSDPLLPMPIFYPLIDRRLEKSHFNHWVTKEKRNYRFNIQSKNKKQSFERLDKELSLFSETLGCIQTHLADLREILKKSRRES